MCPFLVTFAPALGSRKVQTNRSNLFPDVFLLLLPISICIYFILFFYFNSSVYLWKQPCRSHSPDSRTLVFLCTVKTGRPDVKGSLGFLPPADQESPHTFNQHLFIFLHRTIWHFKWGISIVRHITTSCFFGVYLLFLFSLTKFKIFSLVENWSWKTWRNPLVF